MTYKPNDPEPLTGQQPLEQEVARLLVEVLQLDVDAESIVPEEPLFSKGLGLETHRRAGTRAGDLAQLRVRAEIRR